MQDSRIIANTFAKICRNPSFGLATKAKGYKVAGQEEGSPGIQVLRTAIHTKTGNNIGSFGTRTKNTTTHTKLKITLGVEASELEPITQQLTQN
jgi:hypothetical protein